MSSDRQISDVRHRCWPKFLASALQLVTLLTKLSCSSLPPLSNIHVGLYMDVYRNANGPGVYSNKKLR